MQEAVLEQQHSERQETGFKRSCLFCGLVVTGNRTVLFQHMLEDHGFNVGQPDNLGRGEGGAIHHTPLSGDCTEYMYTLMYSRDLYTCIYMTSYFVGWSALSTHLLLCAVFVNEFLDLLQKKLDK